MERAFKANEADVQVAHHKIVDEEVNYYLKKTIHFVNKVVP